MQNGHNGHNQIAQTEQPDSKTIWANETPRRPITDIPNIFYNTCHGEVTEDPFAPLTNSRSNQGQSFSLSHLSPGLNDTGAQ